LASKSLLRGENLVKHFKAQKSAIQSLSGVPDKFVKATDDVSIDIRKGEILSIVGETGSGKTTLGRILMRLLEPTSGKVYFEDNDVTTLNSSDLRQFRKNMHIVFQDPFASLNPRITIGDSVKLPLVAHDIGDSDDERQDMVLNMLEKVGLSPASQFVEKYPHEFSGGQRQRIGVARALIAKPKFIVADEPVSSLDVSIRAQILNLLVDLKSEFDLTYLIISHDLNMVRYMSDRIAVMYLGKIVEIGDSETIFKSPRHPYTRSLLSSIPVPDPDVKFEPMRLSGEMPSPIDPPSGCRFHTRCPFAIDSCYTDEPPLSKVSKDHFSACPVDPLPKKTK